MYGIPLTMEVSNRNIGCNSLMTQLSLQLSSDNQLLCNAFLKWSNWAALIVRNDKCSVFGMKKSKTESLQSQPYVTINYERVQPIKNGDSFTYLGKDFNFNMNFNHVKENLMKTIRDYTSRIDTLPIHPLRKIEICQKYVSLKTKWDLSIYDFSETWMKENRDSHLNPLYRKWLQLPISANITHLQMPQNKLGLNITSAKKLYIECKLSVHRILKTSPNLEARKIYKITSTKHVNSDTTINNIITVDPKKYKLKKTVRKSLTRTITRKHRTISCI